MKFRRIENIRSFYRYYTKDINLKDVEKLFKHDAPEVYGFYKSRMKSVPRDPSFKGRLIFIRDLFIEFLMQLSPPRRFIYTIALILFVLAYFSSNWQWAILAFLAINLLIAFELADKITARDELEIAREIQSTLMPDKPPVNKFFDICGYSESAKEVGGDYFDFIRDEHNDEKLYLVIGDISGKGMAAAIPMVQVRAILHNLISNQESPRNILIALNRSLRKILTAGSFFTASMCFLNGNNKLHLCRAGHLPLIYYSRETNNCCNIVPSGMGIGLGNHKLFENTLEEIILEPKQGDILVFYTDGIIEAMNLYMQEFGENNLKKIVLHNAHKPADMIKDAILHEINLFTYSAPRHDDLTMIVMKAL